jgi:hypothetical protein
VSAAATTHGDDLLDDPAVTRARAKDDPLGVVEYELDGMAVAVVDHSLGALVEPNRSASASKEPATCGLAARSEGFEPPTF